MGLRLGLHVGWSEVSLYRVAINNTTEPPQYFFGSLFYLGFKSILLTIVHELLQSMDTANLAGAV